MKTHRVLPVWLAEIEERLRSGHSTFGAKTVQELMELCKAQQMALESFVRLVGGEPDAELGRDDELLRAEAGRLASILLDNYSKGNTSYIAWLEDLVTFAQQHAERVGKLERLRGRLGRCFPSLPETDGEQAGAGAEIAQAIERGESWQDAKGCAPSLTGLLPEAAIRKIRGHVDPFTMDMERDVPDGDGVEQ